MNDKTKRKANKGKHHNPRWFSPQIFAYEEDERNHSPCISTLSLPCTSLDSNHGYPFTSFLLKSTTVKAKRA